MKNNKHNKEKKTPGFITCDRIDVFQIPPSIKRMAKGREIHVWNRPFKWGLSSATDEGISETPEKIAFNQRLTKAQLEVIDHAVGSRGMDHIKSFLIQKCNVPDPKNLTWAEILSHLEVYLHTQQGDQHEIVKAAQDTAPTKGAEGSWLWRLYEKTLKILVDAFLDRLLPK